MQILLLTILVPFVAAGGGLVGGKTPIENPSFENDTVIMAVEAVNAFFKGKEGDNAVEREPVAILSATTQVVAGINYDYEIKFSNGRGFDTCGVRVWARVWLTDPDEKYITTVKGCRFQGQKQKRGLLGGQEKVSLEDSRVQQALTIFTDTVNGMSNNMYRQVPTNGYATIQIVAGTVYRFYGVTFSSTSCANNSDNNGKMEATECELKPENGSDSSPICGKVTWVAGKSSPNSPAAIETC